ncbi:T9SS type A sorting domain-containing protein [Seonamhaeicola aphaedonensis]|uniref:Putative secreted protein (Por secretion system target) n=1 Tax=Seonamhaeicola aphaedonensis TaxID=1461338 RepID=A0A3D9HLE2_9FLAO|nr:T9SS type A sorting domain-containing protein [Seonamhaeicola aphaedonensis]RED50309.1 putative secreted protein (Por secretion system target) [Seonamhaeicola aphaedonensis]
MKKITLLNLLFALCAFTGFGQTMVDDFESGNGGVEVAFGAASTIVANPNSSGLNTTANCLEITHTNANWYALTRINVNPDLSIGPAESKYLSVLVYNLDTDMACRFDADSDSGNGSNPGVIRAINDHSGADAWEQIIIPIEFPRDAGTFSLGTLYTLVFHADIKDFINANTSPLEGGGKIYIDEIQVLDSNPLSTSDFELSKKISLYPNPVQSHFSIQTKNGVEISKISIYNTLGAKVAVNPVLVGNKYDISSLASGMYLVKISDDKGAVTTKRLLKQ